MIIIEILFNHVAFNCLDKKFLSFKSKFVFTPISLNPYQRPLLISLWFFKVINKLGNRSLVD